MTALLRGIAVSMLVFGLALVGCDESQPEPRSPEPTHPAEPAKAPAAEPAVAEPAAREAEGAGTTLAAALGEVARVDLMKSELRKVGGDRVEMEWGKVLSIEKAENITALLAAIGTDQVATGPLRRCPDVFRAEMYDAAGTLKGSVGVCSLNNLGAQFNPSEGKTGGIELADETAFRTLLGLTADRAE